MDMIGTGLMVLNNSHTCAFGGQKRCIGIELETSLL